MNLYLAVSFAVFLGSFLLYEKMNGYEVGPEVLMSTIYACIFGFLVALIWPFLVLLAICFLVTILTAIAGIAISGTVDFWLGDYVRSLTKT